MPDQVKTYYANGKLLLSGEYFVLQGAKAIALPIRFGQHLTVKNGAPDDKLVWKAWCRDFLWFSCEFDPETLLPLESNDPEKARTLADIFKVIRKMDPHFAPAGGTTIETRLESDPQWGLGSSSTLIDTLAQWAKIDPYLLNEQIFRGSGFDIACASARSPIFYQRNRSVTPVNLNFPFRENLYFVYSGRKKNTRNAVREFSSEHVIPEKLIAQMTKLSEQIAACRDQDSFDQLVREHEQLVAGLIGETPVKQVFFSDFAGEIKSLGAWGGDFYMVSTRLSFPDVQDYFRRKGLQVVFRWNELALENPDTDKSH